jgi:hypothetical protein
MVTPGVVAADFIFWRYLKISFTGLLIILVLANTVMTAIQTHDYSIIPYKIASIALLTTSHASNDAQIVLSGNNPQFELTLKGIWNYLSFYADFILSIWVVFICINLIAKLLAKTSSVRSTLGNYIFAIIIYWAFQAVMILGVAAIYHKIDTIGSIFGYVIMPITSFSLILRAFLRVLSPISDRLSVYTNSTLNTTNLPDMLR